MKTDTSPEVEARFTRMLMARSDQERLRMASSMFDLARRLVIASIREQSPGISEVELRQQLFLRFYGDEFSPEQRQKILARIRAAWERERGLTPSQE